MTTPAHTPAVSKGPDRIGGPELRSIQPVRTIRALLRIESLVIAVGTLSAVGLVLLAIEAESLPLVGMAIGSLVGSLWLGYMARGLAAVIRLLAGGDAVLTGA